MVVWELLQVLEAGAAPAALIDQVSAAYGGHPDRYHSILTKEVFDWANEAARGVPRERRRESTVRMFEMLVAAEG